MREDGITPSNILLISAFKYCANKRDLQTGRRIHAQVGIPNIFVANTVLDMYTKCSSMELAKKLFDEMPNRTIVSWNTMIMGYAQNGLGHASLQMFDRMQEQGLIPDPRTFVAVLKACTTLASEEQWHDIEQVSPPSSKQSCMVKPTSLAMGTELHDKIKAHGHESNIFVASMLLDMYTKCGSISDTRKVFDGMVRRDTVAWNSIIACYTQSHEPEGALELFNDMQEQGFEPDSRTFVSALSACSSLALKEESSDIQTRRAVLQRGREIHTQLAEAGQEADIFVANTLIDMYAKCGSIHEARTVFDRIHRRDTVTWNSMMSGYVQCGEGKLALELYNRMDLVPDSRTFVCALAACGAVSFEEPGQGIQGKSLKLYSLEQGMCIHYRILKMELDKNVFVASSLVDMYSKCGSMLDARRVFDTMDMQDLVAWTALVWGYAHSGEGHIALEVFDRMDAEGLVPDARTYAAGVLAVTKLAEALTTRVDLKAKGADIHSRILKAGYEHEMFVANNLLDMYVKCGSVIDARKLFERMRNRDVVSWTTMICGYAHSQEPEVALELYTRFQTENLRLKPTAPIYIAVLKACGNLSDLEMGRKIHDEVRRLGYDGDVQVVNTLVSLYGRCGSVDEARDVFETASCQDLATWNAIIGGYTHQGDSKNALTLLERMVREGVKPDAITFIHVLSLCSHVGLVEEGRKYFEEMRVKYGISPTLEHYTCMVDLLGRSNKLEEAVDMVRSMPLKPDLATWMSLLSACRKWSNVKLGKLAFDAVISIEERDAGAYSMMANIYATVGLSQECLRIQEMRRKACG